MNSKAPERACMKLAHWPDQDRRLWAAAVAPADPFSASGGSRAGHRPISNRNVERGYGRWLTFLGQRGLLTPGDEPADRMTLENVRHYVGELEDLGNKASTILSRLEELTEMAKIVGPGRSWAFIARTASKVRARIISDPRKRSRLVGTNELLSLGHRLMDSASQKARPLQAAIAHRDGLMIAFLALRALRLRNLSGLTLDKDLLRTRGGWTIILPPSATKTHVTLEYTWPESLVDALETYLAAHRPVLMAQHGRWFVAAGDRLWVSSDGSPCTDASVAHRITKLTRANLGRPISPHLFRDAAATTIAVHDPAHVRSAAPLLGHRDFATTERYYVQAQSLEAQRQYASEIAAMRQKLLSNVEINS